MPSIKARIPHVDLSAYPVTRNPVSGAIGLMAMSLVLKQVLSACLNDVDSMPTPIVPGSWVRADQFSLWVDEAQANTLQRLAEKYELPDISAAASALLHAIARAGVDPNDSATALPESPPAPELKQPEEPAWCITAVDAYTGRQEVMRWRIVEDSEKAVCVETPGGIIWLPRHVVRTRLLRPNEIAPFLLDLGHLCEGEELVRLLSAKETSPRRTRAVVQTIVPNADGGVWRERKRQIWLSSNQVIKDGRSQFAKRWLVSKALEDARVYLESKPRSLRFAATERLPTGNGWAGLPQLEQAIRNVVERLAAR